ncbi:MAG: CoA transferase [Alcaligenaceae bacterium]|nr:CoA transferase [Alcaligenaceae bacterium]
MSLPLEGLKILSVEQYGAGPFGTQHLADLGAEVIKIENPSMGGDVGRHVGPYFFDELDSHFYQSFNRNKKSVTLNLKSKEGMELFRELVKESDAVYNNLRGDLPASLGLTYEDLQEVNPQVVCAHLSAYGREGTRANWPGYDYLMQAEAGYLSLTGEPDGAPARFGLSIIDMMTGTMSALALVSAVLSARETGKGRDIDVSLFSVALHNLSYPATWYLNEGVVTTRQPRSSHPSLTPSQLYRTKDGWIFIMCNKEKFFGLLCEAIGKDEWIDDPRFVDFDARLKNRDLLTKMLDETLSTETTAHWMGKFGGTIPSAPVNDVAQALDNPFAYEQGLVVSSTHEKRGEFRTTACPISSPGVQLPTRRAPKLGEHNAEIFARAPQGDSPEKLEDLKRRGII